MGNRKPTAWTAAVLLTVSASAAAGIDGYSPADHATNVPLVAELSVDLSGPGGSNTAVRFYGRPGRDTPVKDFSIAALPDTQFYSETYHSNFQAQTDWIVAQREALNIKYVAHLGDIVDNGDNAPWEWPYATNALYRLEDPVTTGLPEGIPYGVVPGNHDHPAGTVLYNTYFGVNHFAGKSYYGGHPGSDNQNHYDLIRIGDMDFIFLYIDFYYNNLDYAPIDAWADAVLKTHSNRLAVVVSHDILAASGEFDPRGQAIYSNLKDNPNLFLMLSGHNHGEAFRQETFDGRTVSCCLSDYQSDPNGGNGFLRLYEFSPSNSVIRVKTYSPVLDQYETDADSQFEIGFEMNPTTPFFEIGATNIPAGTTAAAMWPGLSPGRAYEWYVSYGEGSNSGSSSVFRFTATAAGSNAAPAVALADPSDNMLIPPGSNLTLSATASDPDGIIARVDFLANGLAISSDPEAPYDRVWTNPPVGEYSLAAAACDSGGWSVTSAPVSLTVYPLPVETNSLVPANSVWKYLDDGSNQGTAWRAAAFDDSGWAAGPAELGYGDGDETTVVSYGSDPGNKYVTTYFRHAFVASNAAAAAELNLRAVRDDGIAVYLNGTEVYRNNLPAGTIGYTRLASSKVDTPAESTWHSAVIAPDALVEGTNVLAAEIHQRWTGSSDISFKLELDSVFGLPAYLVVTDTAGSGSITPAYAVVPEPDSADFTIAAEPYYHISDLQTNSVTMGGSYGGTTETQTWLSAWSDGELKAVFSANLTTNGTPEAWLAAYGLTNGSFDAEAAADRDGDRLSAAEEYIAGTIPTSALSVFQIAAVASDPVDGKVTLTWPSQADRSYSILCGTNLLEVSSFTMISNNIAATPPTNSVVLEASGSAAAFYKITVE